MSKAARFNFNKVTRRRVLGASGAAGAGALGLAQAGCGTSNNNKKASGGATSAARATTPGAAAAPSGCGGQELVVAQAALFTTLEQQFAVEQETQEVGTNLHAHLLRYKYIPDPKTGFMRQDVSGKPDSFDPELAESWTISDDRLTYTFKLKKGVISPAGNELTAADVVYTIQRIFALKGLGSFLHGIATLIFSPDQVERVDNYTVRFHIQKPFSTFLSGMTEDHVGGIVDSKLLKSKATSADPWAMEFAKANSHGFGAYSVKSVEQGKQAIFEANEHYVHGAPAIKRMIWRVIPDSATRLSLVQKGDVHIAKQMLAREQNSVEGKPGITIPKAFTNLQVFGPLNLLIQPGGDKRVRQAFLYTIPYDDIVKNVYQGRARRQYGIVWDPVPGAHPEYWKPYTTDLNKAKALLAEAGLSGGFESEWAYSLATPDMEEVSVLMRDSAAKVGIKLNLRGLTASALNDINNNTDRTKGIPRLIRDFAIVQTPYYTLSLFFTPKSPINWASYDEGRDQSQAFWDEMQAALAVGDDASPQADVHWSKAQQILAEDSPFFWICSVDPPHIFRSNVEGYAHRTNNVLDYSLLHFKS